MGKIQTVRTPLITKAIKNVMSSAAEAEVGALFINAQEAIPFRKCLDDLGHPQMATPINTDNATAQGIVNDTMKQKRSKAMDMLLGGKYNAMRAHARTHTY